MTHALIFFGGVFVGVIFGYCLGALMATGKRGDV
jgi:F0F1-type ATP synthase assembly protein I